MQDTGFLDTSKVYDGQDAGKKPKRKQLTAEKKRENREIFPFPYYRRTRHWCVETMSYYQRTLSLL
jgi:hypothetical protein